MNHFSYEVMGKEKVRGFQEEGLRNQKVHRTGSSKPSFLHGLPKLLIWLLGMLMLLGLLVR